MQKPGTSMSCSSRQAPKQASTSRCPAALVSACLAAFRPSMLNSTLLQALFRKIAAALPGMQSLSASKPDDMVDVNLSAGAQSTKAGSSASASGCNC